MLEYGIMGGKLIQSVWDLPEKRLSNEEYLIFKDQVLTDMKEIFPSSWKLGVAPAIRQKESHGDLDIIVGMDSSLDVQRVLEEYLQMTVHVNSNVISFPIAGFQVDLTFVPMKDYQSSIDYTSWGDTMNFCGRVAHKKGLSLGHTGLGFWIRQSLFEIRLNFLDNDNIMEKVILTKDFSIILPLLGFDYDVWKHGFDTKEEVYHWVASSKFFDPEIFSFENLNHINRVRNKKRAMYAGFVEWLDKNSWKYNKHIFQRREYYIYDWSCRFPILKEAIKKNKVRYLRDKSFKEKVNGYRVMEILGISDGKEVGRVMGELRKLHTKEEYVNMSQDKVDELILGLNIGNKCVLKY